MLTRKLLFLCCMGGLTFPLHDANARSGSGTRDNHFKSSAATIVPQNLPPQVRAAMHQNIPCLIENVGQIKDQYGAERKDIQFKLPGERFNVFIGAGAIHYQWTQSAATPPGGLQQVKTYRLDMQLLGADPHACLVKGTPFPYKEQYIAGDTKEAGGYQKVTYKNVYPHIDWDIYLKDGKLEYDFVVHPGGNVSDIRIGYNGASSIGKNADGSLTAFTPAGFVQSRAPYSYTAAAGETPVEVASSFTLKDNIAAFSVGKHKGTLVIDPVLEWATYYGGPNTEDAYALAVDVSGDIYMTGYTCSYTNIATTGSYQSQYTPSTFLTLDAYLVKFNPAGTRLWGTYYGGSANESGSAIAIDRWGYVYIAGYTNSLTGISSPGAYQPGTAGNTDAFLVKFTSAGNRIWGTYYGGAGTDYAYALKTDDSGYVYMAGTTNSPDNIASPGSFKPTLSAGSSDAFLVKFESSGMRKWGTYYGAAGYDDCRGITIDSGGNVYIVGATQSTTGIPTPGAFQTTYGGGVYGGDAFIAKFSPGGTQLWSTYYGGTGNDGASAVSYASGKIYVAGYSTPTTNGTSTNLSTPGAFQLAANGNTDAFLARFDLSGNRDWSTYYGGSDADQGNAVLADGIGNVYLLGQTKSTSSIAVPGTLKDTLTGAAGPNIWYDAFLAKFTETGSRIWGTYYGGPLEDMGKGIAADIFAGNLYFCGRTNSQSGIAVPGSFQDTQTNMNNQDAFLVKLYECPTIGRMPIIAVAGEDSICSNAVATYAVAPVPGATSYTWTLPSGWIGSSSGPVIHVTGTNTGGVVSVKAHNSCDTTAVKDWNVYVFPFSPPLITVDSVTLGTLVSYAAYQWFLDGLPISGATQSTYRVTQNGNYQVAVVSENGCADTSVVYVVTNINGHVTAIADPAAIKGQVSVYPNPASEYIRIASPVTVNVTLSTMEGRVLASYNDAKSIPVDSLARGVYLLRITDTSGSFIKAVKFIKE